MSSTIINPKPFLNGLLGRKVVCKMRWGQEFYGYLVSMDGYLNLQMNQIEENIDGTWATLGDGLIRANNILYVRGVIRQNTEDGEISHWKLFLLMLTAKLISTVNYKVITFNLTTLRCRSSVNMKGSGNLMPIKLVQCHKLVTC